MLQEERDRAERAEEMLEQLTRSLVEEKSTSSALLAERAALERLQVRCPFCRSVVSAMVMGFTFQGAPGSSRKTTVPGTACSSQARARGLS